MKKRDRKLLDSIINPIFVILLILVSIFILVSPIEFVRAPLVNASFTLANDPPTQAWNLSIQIGASTIVNETTATNKYLLSTHDFTPIINWTNGTDINGDKLDMFICILSDATTDTCEVYSTWTNQSNLTDFPGLNHSGRWYVNITVNDGSSNSTVYTTNFTINNTLPTISGSALNGNDTHNQTVTLNWSVVDPDNGGNYQWPADTQVDYIVIGNVTGEGVYYNNSDGDANNNSERITSALPWNHTRDDWTANRTYYVTLWSGDGSETNGSAYSTTLRLYDNLPNVTRIWMADDGTLEDCSLAAGSQCSLQAVSHSNVSSLEIQVNATDLDRDCDTASSLATTYLCNRTSGVCNENNYDFNFSLATITKDAGDTRNCSYYVTTGPTGTPQFFVLGSTAYLLQVNVSSQAGQAPGSIKEYNNNATWYYKNVTSVNFTGSVTMGDASVAGGVWNNGTVEYNMTNWGNVILNLTWNITNMSGPGAIGWEMNGTDLLIDDDPNAKDDTGNMTARGLNATNYTFVYSSGLRLCTSYACTGGMVNNVSLPTHWHIYPPSGLTAGTYYGNITYRIFAA